MSDTHPHYMTDEWATRLDRDFTYHPPFGSQTERYQLLRNIAKSLAIAIAEYCPDSREKSLAITHVEDAIMWANAAIARNEQPPEERTS